MDAAEFRMKTDALGLSNQVLYELFPFNLRTIRRWRTSSDAIPPRVAAFVNEQWESAIEQANALLDMLEETRKQTGADPQSVDVPIYRTQESADTAHPGVPMDMLNARAAALAFLVEALGYTARAHYVTHEQAEGNNHVN